MRKNPYFDSLMRVLHSNVKSNRMWPRQFANTLWAFAKIGYDDRELIDLVIAQMQKVRRCKACAVCKACSHRSVLPRVWLMLQAPSAGEAPQVAQQRRSLEVCPSLSEKGQKALVTLTHMHMVATFGVSELFKRWRAANLWAMVGNHSKAVAESIASAAAVQTNIQQWQEQEMSNTIWAMATLGRSSPALLGMCAEEALRRGFEPFTPQAISNFIWGFASLGYSNVPFMTVRCPPLRSKPCPLRILQNLPGLCLAGLQRCALHDGTLPLSS